MEKSAPRACLRVLAAWELDRKSTRLNSSHQIISYAVFCLKKKSQPRGLPACLRVVSKPSQVSLKRWIVFQGGDDEPVRRQPALPHDRGSAQRSLRGLRAGRDGSELTARKRNVHGARPRPEGGGGGAGRSVGGWGGGGGGGGRSNNRDGGRDRW